MTAAVEALLAPLSFVYYLLIAFGGFLLWVSPRSVPIRALAAWIVLRAVTNLAGGIGYGGMGLIGQTVSSALVPLSTTALVILALSYPKRRGIARARWGIPALTLVGAVLSAAVLFAPSLVARFSVTPSADITASYGPLALLALNGLAWTTYGILALVFARDWILERPGPTKLSLLLLTVGLGFETTLTGLLNLAADLDLFQVDNVYSRYKPNMILLEWAWIPALAAGALLLVGGLRARDRGARRMGLAGSTVFALAIVAGALALRAGGSFLPAVLTTQRLVLPVLIGYALLRHQIFDIDLNVKRGIGAVVGRRAADKLLPNVDGSTEYLLLKKLEVYKHALDERMAEGHDPATDTFLRSIRAGLQISDAEHRALVLVSRSQARRPGIPVSAAGRKYAVERELGRGGFGAVYLARDTTLDRHVVLKQPTGLLAQDAGARELFLKEARLAARIQHPNVVGIFDVLEQEDPPMIVMEYVPGGSIEDTLTKRGRLPPEEVRRLARDVLAGLDRIHREGIVHRDIKPANILLGADGSAKITDFGIAHAPASVSALVTVAGTGYQPGTLAYMSPEQARGDPLDARSDLFSLAVVLHQALTGRHYLGPIDEPDYKVRQRIQEAIPLTGADIAGDLGVMLGRALATDPAARYATAADMALALDRSSGAAPRGVREASPA